jgi:hypothetical protein
MTRWASGVCCARCLGGSPQVAKRSYVLGLPPDQGGVASALYQLRKAALPRVGVELYGTQRAARQSHRRRGGTCRSTPTYRARRPRAA